MLDKLMSTPLWPPSMKRTKRIELRFVFPAPDKETKIPQFASSKFAGHFNELKANPIEQIRLMRGEIRALNRCRLRNADRLAVNREGLSHVYPVMLGELRKYSKEGGIPDNPIRQESLDHITEILKLLVYSYLMVFKGHYDDSDGHFERKLEEVGICACRILELTRLKQRTRALRYQSLSETAWYIVNTVFHIMHMHGDIESPVTMMESELLSGRGERTTNLRVLFGALQMTSRLDMLRWPVAYQTLFVGYQDSLPDAISVLADHTGPVTREQMLTYSNDDQSARQCRKQNEADHPVVRLDWSSMAKRLRQDCLHIIKAARSNSLDQVPEKFRLFSNVERLALAQLLLRSMESTKGNNGYQEREEQILGMQIYVGFKEIYLLAKHILSGKASDSNKRFVDLFAERSAMIAEDHNTAKESLWYTLHQDSQTIRLKTQETRFTHQMEIGSLIAYGLGAKDLNRPRLGVVSRLHRPNATSVIIDLERLAKYAEPVGIMLSEEGQAHNEPLHALVIHDPALGWNLIFPPHYNLTDSKQVQMIFRGKSHFFSLGTLRYVTSGMYMFSIPLDTVDLGLKSVPSYPESKPHQ